MWKKIRKNYRRLIASLLTLAMVVTNAGGNVGTIFAAGESENALFLVDGEELKGAIREAEELGEVFDFASLRLAAKRKSIKTRYEKLLGKKEGKVYALDLEIDDSYAPEGTELQVFYNAGTEDVIFLFLNESDLVVDYRVNIDGYETEPVRVSPNTANIEMDGEETPSYAENYEAADMIDDESKKVEAEVVGSQESTAAEETGSAAEDTEDQSAAAGEETGAEVNGETDAEDESKNESQDTVKETESGEKSGEDRSDEEAGEESEASEAGEDQTEEPAGDKEEESEAEETEAESEEETEAATEEEPEADAEDGELLSLSRHEAALVAVSLEDLEEGEPEIVEETEAEPEEEETGEETEAEPESESQEEESESGTEAESKPEETEEETEGESKPKESVAATEGESKSEESKPEESEAGTEAESKPEESEAETGKDIIIEETKGEEPTEEIRDEENSADLPDSDSNKGGKEDLIEMDGQLLEDDDVEILGELKGKEYDTVTILDHVNARALKIAWEDIDKIITSDGMDYAVDYVVNLPEGAEVTGADTVAEGEDLYFAVDVEDGYELAAVYANGSEVEELDDASDLASASNWKGYSHVYVVKGVAEDLWIDVEVEELEKVIAEKTYTAETNDAVFTVNVPEGAFEEEVELRVTKIVNRRQLEELSDQANSALKANKAVAGIMAYDVTFVSVDGGKEIEPAKAVEVSIRLKKSVETKDVEEADVTGISVVHLPENDKAEVVASAEDVKEKEFEFQTDGFSIYVIAAEKAASVELDGKSYSTIAEAINSITDQENETIVLLEDISENVVSNGKSYTLNLNGKKLSSKALDKSAYTINGGKVTIQDGTITGTKKRGSADFSGIRSVNADVALKNCVIEKNTGNRYGGGIYAEQGSLTLEDCNVAGNTATYGAGIYALNCEVEIKGNSKINGNTGANSSSAGGIYIKGGSLITGNGQEGSTERTIEISNNNPMSTTTNGVYLLDCSAQIKDAKISANGFHGVEIKNTKAENSIIFDNVEFSKHGIVSALYVNSQGEFIATNCDFINNTLKSSQKINAALCLGDVNASKTGSGGKKTVSNCRFTNNTASSTASSNPFPSGAIAVKEKNQTIIEDCEFAGNKGKIGALYIFSATVDITGKTVFSSNEGILAGAIQAASGITTISGVVIKNNKVNTTTASAAGGINVAGGTFKMNKGIDDIAVYNNLYNDESRDLRLNTVTSNGIEILSAQEMRDPDSELKWEAWNDGNQDVTEKLTSKSGTPAAKSKTGVWKAVEKTISEVAQIGEVKYETLSQAIEAVKPGEVITLIEEAVPAFETVKINKNVVIDMNNCRIEPVNMNNSDPLISIESGGELTLSGNGVIGNWISIRDENKSGKPEGSLYLEGNIRVESLSMNDIPIENYGTVVIRKDIDSLLINTYKGNVEVAEGVNIGKLDILETVGFKRVYPKNVVINGAVDNLILTQRRTQKADIVKATLNGKIGNLTLKHEGSSYGVPETYAGENFSADTIQLTPALGYTNPAYNDLLDPKKEADDIFMIQGSEGHPIQADQVNNLENVVWKRPNESTENDNMLRFLVKPAIDDKGNLVLRKFVSNGIYLDGEKGSDESNSGLAADEAVSSFKKAKKLLSQTGYDTIYVVGTVTVGASDTEWTFGDLEGNEGNSKQYKLQRYLKHFGALVRVPNGTELTLKDIIIDGGGSEINTRYTSVTDPLVMNDGTLKITNGAVLRNNHNVYQDVFHEGGAVRNAGTLTMDGGTIEANSAVSGGGVFNRGTFDFSGGEIKNNAGKGMHRSSGTLDKNGNYKTEIFNAGGGVFIANSGTMTMSGSAVISGNTAKIGGGISLGNNHNVYIGGTFTMEGGTIENNEAEKEGGGIFIQENCKAKVTKGDIINNKSHGGAFGGGGVYVNGGTGLGKNGLLELENVRISNNESAGRGGGIAACPSANVKIYLDNGGLIKYNTGKGKDFDIYSTNNGYNKHSNKGIYLSRYMMGGASYDWTDVPDEARNEFCVYSASEKVSAPDDKLLVRITGNTADTQGGGIGANGDVIIGKDTADLMEVSVSKEWKYDKDGEFVSGIENLKPINQAIGSVTFQLQERKKLKDGEQDNDQGWNDVVYGGKANSVPNGEKWSTITFVNLRKVDSDGDEVEYRIIELTDDGFILVDTKHEIDESTGNSSWTFTNMPAYSLKLVKKVEDNYNKYSPDKKFTFEITLEKTDKTLYDGTISAAKGLISSNEDTSQPEETVDVVFTDGKASVELGKDEYIHLKGLTAGMKYSVTEIEESDYETSINGEVTNTVEGMIQIGVNQVEYLNRVKEPHGKLKIKKIVEDGDLTRDWHFSIRLQNPDGKPLDTIGEVYSFTYYEGPEEKEIASTRQSIQNGKVDIVLKHNQSLEIDSFPAGTVYIVEEQEANQDNYTALIEAKPAEGMLETIPDNENSALIIGGKGQIREKETVEVIFNNKLNTGDLVISKIVSALGNNLTQANRDAEFTFLIELKNDQPLKAEYSYTGDIVEGIENVAAPDDGVLSFDEEGKAEVVLKHGQQIRITGLSSGTEYKVTEKTADGYSLTMVTGGKVESGEVVNDKAVVENEEIVGREGTIRKDSTAKVEFTNTVKTNGLIISKMVSGNNLTEEDTTASFTFQLDLKDSDGNTLSGSYQYTGSKEGNISSGGTVELSHGQSIHIEGLPDGTIYTVTEIGENAKAYTISVSGGKDVTLDASVVGSTGEIKEGEGAEAIFVNHKPDTPPPTPNRPGGGGGNPGGPRGGGDNPGGPGTPTTTIDEPGVPLADLPPEAVTELLEDSDVPLAALPRTGDSRHNGMLMMLFGIAGLGMLLSAAGLKKRKDESDD